MNVLRTVKILSCLGIIFFILTFSFPAQSSAAGLASGTKVAQSYVSNEILVKLKPGQEGYHLASITPGSTSQSLLKPGFQKVKLPPGTDVAAAIRKYEANPNVEYAEPNYTRQLDFLPNDPGVSRQWALSDMDVENAWNISRGSPSIIVAVIDTGIDINHPDLRDKIVDPFNAVTSSTSISSVIDDVGHGTHVAGIIAADLNNGIGIAGVGGNVKIMPIKADSYDPTQGQPDFADSDIANGIYWAVNHGARVINMSLGGSQTSSTLNNAVNYALQHNVVVVAAAGNDGTNVPDYPAACSGVIAVAATDQTDTDTSWSNYGSYIDISAPGADIYSTTPTYSPTYGISNLAEKYDYLSGTSMASPEVAGLAALVLSVKPNLTVNQVQQLIYSNARDVDSAGWDQFTGWGIIDAAKTLFAEIGPIGSLDYPRNGQTLSGNASVGGWFLDQNIVSKVEVLVDGVAQGQASYGTSRPDVYNFYPESGNANSGFVYSLNTRMLRNGSHVIQIRETSSNNTVNTLPGVQVVVANPPAIGFLDSPSQGQNVRGTLNVSGWALDGSVVKNLTVMVDGQAVGQAVYDDARPDVAKVFPAYENSNSGFHFSLNTSNLTQGNHVIAISETAQNNTVSTIAQRNITIPVPIGCIDTPGLGATLAGQVNVNGWVLDGDGVAKLEVLVDGAVQGEAAYGGYRPDVAKAFPAYGNDYSGFSFPGLNLVNLSHGTHTISIRETDTNNNQHIIAAKTFNLAGPMGFIDTPGRAQEIKGTVNVNGWFLDGSGVSKLELLVDGALKEQVQYGSSRPDVARVFPLYGNTSSGFQATLDTTTLSNGSHVLTVRETAVDGQQSAIQLPVEVYNAPTNGMGCLDFPSQGSNVSGIASVSGWFLDANKVSELEVLVDGVVQGQAHYGDSRPDVQRAFPSYNNSYAGFDFKLNTALLTNGPHTLIIRETSGNGVIATISRNINVTNLPAMGWIDSPSPGTVISGAYNVSGWLLDGSGVKQIDVLVDGIQQGQAVYGDSRPDVYNVFPRYNNKNAGYHYSLDTSTLSSGTHTITIRETALNGVQTVISTTFRK